MNDVNDKRAAAWPMTHAATLRAILETLKNENEKPVGLSAICDTIWYSKTETLFDFIESAIAAADSVSEQPSDLLRMLAERARCFPGYPMGYHLPELFALLGEEPPRLEAEQPSEQPMLNGLTEAQTAQTASVAGLTLGDAFDRVAFAAAEQPSEQALPPLPQAAVFDRRWRLADDGFGVQRDDERGNYVYLDDALRVLHQHLAARQQPAAQAPAPAHHEALWLAKWLDEHPRLGSSDGITWHQVPAGDNDLYSRAAAELRRLASQPPAAGEPATQQPAERAHVRNAALAVLKQLGEPFPRDEIDLDAVGMLARAVLAQQPAERVPLTYAEIAEGRYRMWSRELEEFPEPWAFSQGARFAERHHGIKPATSGETR